MASFFTWGMLAIYWSFLKDVHPVEIVAHRAIWSLVFAGGLIIFIKTQRLQVIKAFKTPKLLFTLLCSGMMIATNWGTYIWAVTSGHIVETSMGYYINPLLNAAASTLIFKAPMNKFQTSAILFAVIGVANIIIGYGSIPYVAISLALSFCLYGIIRKAAPIDALAGLFIETAFMALPAAVFILYKVINGTGAVPYADAQTISLLLFGGVVTTLPLAGFAYGAKHLTLSTVGIMQYISPTTSFLLGVFIYHETFTKNHLVSFMFIWIGLIIYSADSIIRFNTNKKTIKR